MSGTLLSYAVKVYYINSAWWMSIQPTRTQLTGPPKIDPYDEEIPLERLNRYMEVLRNYHLVPPI
ncbi:uncharacterized protein N7483_006647 [Penicillium malachiteum]|uniref:uncharacterized protein n=1 Tax=Penicillium malachiteum TaxID=1324776 RepID=UPI002548FC15|nr:uncharacterized protein N7483_006647 [Penicillium malachiteum]KAJ5725290.1 hypothetical protein N7483_006647 [Penicillium malachiteum]